MQKKYLINYANEKYRQAQILNTKSANKYCNFDTIIEYSPNDIDEEYKEKNSDIFSFDRGDGLWLWKPYLIKKTLELVEYDDIVFYSDSGTCFINDCTYVFDILKEQDIWITVLPLIEKQWTKKYVFDALGMNFEKWGDTNQISGTFLAVKKTKKAVEFVNEWLMYCSDLNCISPYVDKNSEDSSFISHREDQSILSLLAKKYGIRSFSDPTQYGVNQDGYYSKGRIIKYIKYNNYPPFLLHHRKSNPSLFDLLKCYIRIYIPKNVLNIIDRRK